MYTHIVLGGTFDHLHAGHLDLLATAFSQGQKVTLGLTKASMNREKILSDQIQPYKIRQRAIQEYARSLKREKDLRIIPIKDMFGSTLTDQSLTAIVVTPQTKKGAEIINRKRDEIGLPSLSIIVCPLRHDDSNTILCSSNIRLGLVNRTGTTYRKIFATNVFLSDSARAILHRPFGRATGARSLKTTRNKLFVVGDIVTQYCIDHSIQFSRAYVDGQSKQKAFNVSFQSPYHFGSNSIHNPAGSLTVEAAQSVIEDSLQPNTIIQVDGEEDLLTVASVILLPLGSKIVYGYPYRPESMRVIYVTERLKEKFALLFTS